MKTAKYILEIDMLDTDMVQSMELTKKEYNRQLAYLHSQVQATADHECPVEETEHVLDRDGYTKTINMYSCGCCTTYLIAYECRPGYHLT
jgi:hypothetical protein